MRPSYRRSESKRTRPTASSSPTPSPTKPPITSPTPTSGIALPLTTRQTQYLPFCSASDLCQCRRGDRV